MQKDRKVRTDYIEMFGPKRLLLVSYEDQNLEQLLRPADEVGTTKRTLKIVILRDAFNLFASLVKSGMLTQTNEAHYQQLFRQYAKLFAGVDCPDDVIALNFNQWCSTPEYRRQMAERIGFVTDGSPWRQLSYQGGGSSFSGRSFEGRADELDVLNRLRQMAGNPLFASVVKNSVTARLSEQIFGKMND